MTPKQRHDQKKESYYPTNSREVVVSASFNDFDEFLLSYMTDVPGGGIFLETEQKLPLGTKVRLDVTFSGNNHRIIEGYGEVIRLQREDDENVSGMVIKFLDLQEKSKLLLSRLVENYL